MKSADRKLAYSAIIVLAVIAAELAWFLFIGPANNGSNQEATQQQENLFLGLSAEAWTALFTAVLTGGTLALWWQTRRLAEGGEVQGKAALQAAEAASKQAAASLGVELPRLILTDVYSSGIAQYPRSVLANFGPSVRFENHGRTAAVIVGDCVQIIVAREIPTLATYARGNIRRAPLATIIEPTKDYTVDFNARSRATISEGDINEIILGDKSLWVYGFIRYRDFMSESHILGFCTRLQINRFDKDESMFDVRFVEDSKPAYTYDKYAAKPPT